MPEYPTVVRRPFLTTLLALASLAFAFVCVLSSLIVLLDAMEMPSAFTPIGREIASGLRQLAGADPRLFLLLRGPLAILLFLAGNATICGDYRGRIMYQLWAWGSLGVFAFGLVFAIQWQASDWFTTAGCLALIMLLEHPAMVADFDNLRLVHPRRSRPSPEHSGPADEFLWEDPQ